MTVIDTVSKTNHFIQTMNHEGDEVGQPTLRSCVENALTNYFSQLEGQQVTNLYNLVLAEIEAPLLESVLRFTKGNQTQASVMLGLNRGTLRKKLKMYGLN